MTTTTVMKVLLGAVTKDLQKPPPYEIPVRFVVDAAVGTSPPDAMVSES